jgi:lysozyme family protein
LKWEGGYSNDPRDPGGPTMKGIIQREYDAWLQKKGRAPGGVRNISNADLRAIYKARYWDACACDNLPAGMNLCVFDAAVNSGTGRAKAWLKLARDIDAFCDMRLAFLQRLGRLWRAFGAGWRRRVAGIRERAHLMAGEPSPSQNPAADSKSAPSPAHAQTPRGDISMTTATKPAVPAAPQTSASWISSIFSDIVDAAQTSFSKVWTAIAGMFGSASAGAAIVGILTHINPSWTAIAVGVLGILGTILGAAASAYHLITHMSATNYATIALAEKWLNTAEVWFGRPQIDFSAANGDATAPASARPASGAGPAPAGA